MPDLFDTIEAPLVKGPGTIFDYDASAIENLQAQAEQGWIQNPIGYLGRQARFAAEDFNANVLGTPVSPRVDAESARAEIKRRGLDLKVPDSGISRYELDALQYLKQRENNAALVSARTHGAIGTLAGFAGGFAAQAVDPINIASAFIPIISEVRYANMMKGAITPVARAGVRATAGAIEGAAGAAMIEPFIYAGAQAEQANYSLSDSFTNVVFGTVLGSTLHVTVGALADRFLPPNTEKVLRDAVANMAPEAKMQALKIATEALESGRAPDVVPTVVNAIAPEKTPPTQTQTVEALATGDAAAEAPTQPQEVTAATVEPETLKDAPKESVLAVDEMTPAADATPDAKQYSVTNQDGSPVALISGRFTQEGRFEIQTVERADASQPLDPETEKAATAQLQEQLPGTQVIPRARNLADLIAESKQDRTQSAFDRQFTDKYAEQDAATSQQATETIAEPDQKIEVSSDTADTETQSSMLDAHLDSMRERGILSEADEAAIKAADEAAKDLEVRADAYEAAAACEIETAA